MKAIPTIINEYILALSCYDGNVYVVEVHEDVVKPVHIIEGSGGALRAAPAYSPDNRTLIVASLDANVISYHITYTFYTKNWGFSAGDPSKITMVF